MSVWYIKKSEEEEEEKVWGLSNSILQTSFQMLASVLPYLVSSVVKTDSDNSPPIDSV